MKEIYETIMCGCCGNIAYFNKDKGEYLCNTMAKYEPFSEDSIHLKRGDLGCGWKALLTKDRLLIPVFPKFIISEMAKGDTKYGEDC